MRIEGAHVVDSQLVHQKLGEFVNPGQQFLHVLNQFPLSSRGRHFGVLLAHHGNA